MDILEKKLSGYEIIREIISLATYCLALETDGAKTNTLLYFCQHGFLFILNLSF